MTSCERTEWKTDVGGSRGLLVILFPCEPAVCLLGQIYFNDTVWLVSSEGTELVWTVFELVVRGVLRAGCGVDVKLMWCGVWAASAPAVSEHECFLTELSLSHRCYSLSCMSSPVNGNSTPDTLPLWCFHWYPCVSEANGVSVSSIW